MFFCWPGWVHTFFSMCYELYIAWHGVFLVPHFHIHWSTVSCLGDPFPFGVRSSLQIWKKRLGCLRFFIHKYHDWPTSGTQNGKQTYWWFEVLVIQSWFWWGGCPMEHWWRRVRLVYHILKIATWAEQTRDWHVPSRIGHVYSKSYRLAQLVLLVAFFFLACSSFSIISFLLSSYSPVSVSVSLFFLFDSLACCIICLGACLCLAIVSHVSPSAFSCKSFFFCFGPRQLFLWNIPTCPSTSLRINKVLPPPFFAKKWCRLSFLFC